MANRLFQTIVQQLKPAISTTFGVLDEGGAVVACSDLSAMGEVRAGIRAELNATKGVCVIGGTTYRHINHDLGDIVVFIEGAGPETERLSLLFAVAIGNIKGLYDEKYDKTSFVKNIMLDNILPGDVFVKGKELHFVNEAPRAVLVIHFPNRVDTTPLDIIAGMFPDKGRDYVISISEHEVALVKEVETSTDMQELENLAGAIVETLTTESYCRYVYVGISTIVDSLKELARAYKEARAALEVRKVFDTERSVVSYCDLGIGRLIYQLPTSLCEAFLAEVFQHGSIDAIDSRDDDTQMKTVRAFFGNNLNVSKTADSLYVHRNTLVYRLEKIRKQTGLDLREFEHAVTFKVALMVRKYLANKPAKF